MRQRSEKQGRSTPIEVKLRNNPHPYRAMIAICSDLDETPCFDTYIKTMEYLNSTKVTPFGAGVGLEVGNSMYFYMPAGEFSYFNAKESEQVRIRQLMQAGLVDCIHSYGDTATTRSQAAKVLEHLSENNCNLDVWIDHAQAPSNFGGDIMCGFGDVPSSAIYHADLTVDYGVKFVWLGRVTSVQGQDAPLSVRGIFDEGSPIGSSITLAKESAKIVLGAIGVPKYAMHASNALVRPYKLRDGTDIVEFKRCNANPLGVSIGETATGLADAISPSVLDRVEKNESRMIVYTHLGKQICQRTGFNDKSRRALEILSDRYRSGKILVTTTSRLLNYVSQQRKLTWTARQLGQRLEIAIGGVEDVNQLQGITFETYGTVECEVVLQQGRRRIPTKAYVENGQTIVTVPWSKGPDIG